VIAVRDPVGARDLRDDPRERRIVQVAHARKQVMLDLIVEAPREPREDAVVVGEADSGPQLMLREVDVQLAALARGDELGRVHAVGELEHARQRHAEGDDGDRGVNEDDADGVKERWDEDRPRQEEQLREDERERVEGRGPRKTVRAEAPAEPHDEIIHEGPLRQEQRVEPPQVPLLIAVDRSPPLLGGEPHRGPEVEIEVDPLDVGEAVVQHVVLVTPDERREALCVEREPKEAIDGARAREGTVVRVVLDRHADPGDGQAERDGEQDGREGALDPERQERPRADPPPDDDRALQIHPR